MPKVLAEILGPDMLVILAIVALLFGGSQIPKFARSLGSAKREFERGLSDDASETETEKGKGKGKSAASDSVTMTRRELDALVAEREAAARSQVEHDEP